MSDAITQADVANLELVYYPDPRLRETCEAVATFDGRLRSLVERMFELMFTARGVGLAGPQVGVPARLFVASPTFQEDDRRLYVNPQIVSFHGRQEGDEGCLSFPEISCRIKRYNTVTIRALDLKGRPFEETGEGLTARIFQHECDHLEGVLLSDRMGSVARLSNRRALKDLEERFARAGA